MLSSKTLIADVMTATPHTVGRDQKLAVAYDLMQKHGLRHLPVLEAGQLVGVVSHRDLLFLETMRGIDRRTEHVSEAMSVEVFTATPCARLTDVARTMAEHRYGCAVVVDGVDVIGIFTATDALALLARLAS